MSDFKEIPEKLRRYDLSKTINRLVSCLYNPDKNIKWNAVSALGVMAAELEKKDPESARIIVRRLVWSLTEESGGIGWGAPEAIAEILVNSEKLAGEYINILISFMRIDGSFLEYEPLQQGVLWGIYRLASKRPELFRENKVYPYIMPYFKSPDKNVKGLAVLVVKTLGIKESQNGLKAMINNDYEIEVYEDFKFVKYRTGEVAKQALERLFLNK